MGTKCLLDRVQSLVLENLVHPFLKPNILDIKLGTVLYDESASPEKVERMLNTAKNTTSFETGVRLTGFQVSGKRHSATRGRF
jgi:1D-myo-inositol-tetrakisphosphate 5-kinase/inositol-polyphosphate multikinase